MRSPRPCSFRAFTVPEMIFAAAITGVLIWLIIGTATMAVGRGRSVQCVNHLRQLGIAAHLFANDHQRRLPVPKDWTADGRDNARWFYLLTPYLKGPDVMGPVFRCPNGEAQRLLGNQDAPLKWTSTDYTVVISYYGGRYHWIHSIIPHLTALIVEAENFQGTLGYSSGNVQTLINERVRKRHGGVVNVLFADGTVHQIANPSWENIRPHYPNTNNRAP